MHDPADQPSFVNEYYSRKIVSIHLSLIQLSFKRAGPSHSDNLSNKSASTKIGLASQNKVDFVEIARITRCEADNNYTHVFHDSQVIMVISKTLKEFEELLSDHGFIRIHQSHLINTSVNRKLFDN